MSDSDRSLERILDATRGLVTAMAAGDADSLGDHWRAREQAFEQLHQALGNGESELTQEDLGRLEQVRKLDRQLVSDLETGLQETRTELASIESFRKSVRRTGQTDAPRFLSYRA